MKIIFIHGRAQEETAEVELIKKWKIALQKSFETSGHNLPEALHYELPYYAHNLIELRDKFEMDIKSGKYKMKGKSEFDPLGGFEAEFIEELFVATGLSKREAIKEYEQENGLTDGTISQQARGLENNFQVLALARKIDRTWRWLGNYTIKKKTSDVAAYLMIPNVQEEINSKIRGLLDNEPTIIIAHSLGTVVAYQVLRALQDDYFDIRALITLGSPLGVKAVQRQLQYVYNWPPCLNGPWINIYDKRDIVSLNPIKESDFRNMGKLENIVMENSSENRHDIVPYLSHPFIAETIVDILQTEEQNNQ